VAVAIYGLQNLKPSSLRHRVDTKNLSLFQYVPDSTIMQITGKVSVVVVDPGAKDPNYDSLRQLIVEAIVESHHKHLLTGLSKTTELKHIDTNITWFYEFVSALVVMRVLTGPEQNTPPEDVNVNATLWARLLLWSSPEDISKTVEEPVRLASFLYNRDSMIRWRQDIANTLAIELQDIATTKPLCFAGGTRLPGRDNDGIWYCFVTQVSSPFLFLETALYWTTIYPVLFSGPIQLGISYMKRFPFSARFFMSGESRRDQSLFYGMTYKVVTMYRHLPTVWDLICRDGYDSFLACEYDIVLSANLAGISENKKPHRSSYGWEYSFRFDPTRFKSFDMYNVPAYHVLMGMYIRPRKVVQETKWKPELRDGDQKIGRWVYRIPYEDDDDICSPLLSLRGARSKGVRYFVEFHVNLYTTDSKTNAMDFSMSVALTKEIVMKTGRFHYETLEERYVGLACRRVITEHDFEHEMNKKKAEYRGVPETFSYGTMEDRAKAAHSEEDYDSQPEEYEPEEGNGKNEMTDVPSSSSSSSFAAPMQQQEQKNDDGFVVMADEIEAEKT
jgi:hypothetical protein